jgi:class 3 adenylate cyclase/predicted ATPase
MISRRFGNVDRIQINVTIGAAARQSNPGPALTMAMTPTTNADEWLESLGLGQYRALFAEQAIDFDILPELTDQDLAGLGVPLGHRKKMMRAIARLGTGGNIAAPQPDARHFHRTERRQVTILICDLVNSTALASQLELEDMQTVVNACLDACTAAVARFDGQVARLLGDGLMAYFGYPYASEHAAESATQAAIHAVLAVSRLDVLPGIKLQVRAGIATGLVVVGDLLGEGPAREELAVGTAPALAARLTALAPPGGVLIDPTTRRLIRERFELEPLGAQPLKGIATDTPVWRILGERRVETRFEAAQGRFSSEVVDREDETALLLSRWDSAADERGQVVLLRGEAGIGKSRLCTRLCEHVMNMPHTLVRLQCSPFHTNSALYPVVTHLEWAAGLLPEHSVEEKRQLLASLMADTVSSEDLPFLEMLLSIRPADGGTESSLRETKQRTFEVLANRLVALSRRKPVLCVIEDIHWVDPTTLELIDLCIERIKSAAILILVTCRPEFEPKWNHLSHVTVLNLNPLGRDHAAELVRQEAGGKTLPAEVLENILTKTDGVPLFVEELTRTVIESGMLEEHADEYVLVHAPSPVAIPETLQGSLLARLDHLAPVREVAQIAAAIGREFSYELIAAIQPSRISDLDEALKQLVASGLIHLRGTSAVTTFAFKHALVRDAAYSTLLRSKRNILHARIAEVLCNRFPETAASQPELVAYHFTAAGLTEAAVRWWFRAGERAVFRSANTEAVAHLSQARELLLTLSEEVRARYELALETALGQATTELRGYAAPETLAVWKRARALLGPTSDPSRKFAVFYGLWAAAYVRGETKIQQQVASEALEEAELLGDTAGLCVANRNLGTTLVMMGELQRGRQHLERARELYDPEQHRPLMYRFGHDIGATALSHLTLVLYHLGHIDQAMAMAARAVRHAEALKHPHTLVYTLGHAVLVLDACRARIDNHAIYDDVLALCRKHDFRFWGNLVEMYRSWAAICRGDIVGPLATFRQALQAVRATEVKNWIPLYQALYAQGLAKSGDKLRALDVTEEAASIARSDGEVFAMSEVLRLKSNILLELGRHDDAQASLMEALTVARNQGALCFELRAAVDLARIATGRSERERALAALRSAYGKFSEGFTSHELMTARSVLVMMEGRDADCNLSKMSG